MHRQATGTSITDINRRYLTTCLRLDEDYLAEASIALWTPMPLLKSIRSLNHDQIEAIIATPHFLLQPSFDERTVAHAAALASPLTRKIFLGSSVVRRNAVI